MCLTLVSRLSRGMLSVARKRIERGKYLMSAKEVESDILHNIKLFYFLPIQLRKIH